MEFPIEIQMLINDYARPISRPDWRKGSFMVRYYRSEKGKWGCLPIWDFKDHINLCRLDKLTKIKIVPVIMKKLDDGIYYYPYDYI